VPPLTVLPSAGEVIDSVAGDAGRVPEGVPGGRVAEGVAPAVGGWVPALPHAAQEMLRTATTAAVRAVLMGWILILGR
jgi:hypothetical protein